MDNNVLKVVYLKTNKIMSDKMLLVLPKDNKYARMLRRGLVVALFTFISFIIKDSIANAPDIYVPLLTALMMMLDKFVREFKDK